MKNLIDIINQIFDVIPDSYEDKEFLSLKLGSIKESSRLASPETQRLCWSRFFYVIDECISPIEEDWKTSVALIIQSEATDWKQGF